jgi:small subunit ribosomal protein S6
MVILGMPFKQSAIGGSSDRLTGFLYGIWLMVYRFQIQASTIHHKPSTIYLFPFVISPKSSTFAAQLIFLNKIREMNNYELMVIFTPVLSEEEFKAAQIKFTTFVKDNGGKVVHDNPWGLKSLAYPIQKKTTGLYWVLEYDAPSDFNEKLKIQILRDETVLRFMATKLDKYAVEYNARKKSGVQHYAPKEKAEA